ncbi:hypothetical protein HELRODRAFT_190022 [Helobdella robusta]|uniref:Ig-like domain-containing protein n=1 Tax=Helobdella robusta TaxID=6412 RepID=T1FRL7_HELRO|nr:hypothetical protein HELRODRAFT_190022 [Helobdella robusta]ESO11594.1 hypothetical protein HELRODRAFT_190022 [Helobdella robusta]
MISSSTTALGNVPTVTNERISMISKEPTNIQLNAGEPIQLECKFVAEHFTDFNLFDYPISWHKGQLDDSMQINMVSNILEPFAATERFAVQYAVFNLSNVSFPVHKLALLVSTSISFAEVYRTKHFETLQQNVVDDSENDDDIANDYTYSDHHFSNNINNINNNINNNNNFNNDIGVHLKHRKRRRSTDLHFNKQSNRRPQKHQLSFTEHDSSPQTTSTSSHQQQHQQQQHQQQVICTVHGGYPRPNVTMKLGNVDVTNLFAVKLVHLHTLGSKGFQKFSYRLTFSSKKSLTFKSQDHGKNLTCSGTVAGLQSVSAVSWINVYYAPKIRCRNAVASLNDLAVTLTCEVKANPEATMLFWIVDTNSTKVTDGRENNEFWNKIRVLDNGALEASLNIRRVAQRHFRNYVIVAENDISSQSGHVKLLQKFHGQNEKMRALNLYSDYMNHNSSHSSSHNSYKDNRPAENYFSYYSKHSSAMDHRLKQMLHLISLLTYIMMNMTNKLLF